MASASTAAIAVMILPLLSNATSLATAPARLA